MRKRWIVAPEGTSYATHPATFGILRCWTFYGANWLARKLGREFGVTWEVYGPIGKAED
jgi:hypothetical protein